MISLINTLEKQIEDRIGRSEPSRGWGENIVDCLGLELKQADLRDLVLVLKIIESKVLRED